MPNYCPAREQQARCRAGEGRKLPVAFVEFDTMGEAQAAHQSLTYHQPLNMDLRLTGMSPSDIIWPNLKIRGRERFVRQVFVVCCVATLVLFWSFPVALIGFVSNLQQWTAPDSPIPWLRWLQRLPPMIFGIVSGFLPSVTLSILMSLLPSTLRCK
jgi:hypothetical protein